VGGVVGSDIERNTLPEANARARDAEPMCPERAGVGEIGLHATAQTITTGKEAVRSMTNVRWVIVVGQRFKPDESWRKYDAGEFK